MSFCQPTPHPIFLSFDMGIIRDIKSLYLKEIVINLNNSTDEKQFDCTILRTWKNISTFCIQNCFHICGFMKILNDNLLDEWIEHNLFWANTSENSENVVSFEEYVNVGNDASADNDTLETVSPKVMEMKFKRT